MALPKSTILFGVVTCVPFALAIVETAKGKGGSSYSKPAPQAVEPMDDDAAMEALMAAHAREEAQQAEAQRKADAEVAIRMRAFHGTVAASLGPALPGFSLGMTAEAYEARHAELEEPDHIGFELEGEQTLHTITIVPYFGGIATEPCDAVGTQLSTKWGAGAAIVSGRSWVDPIARQRAVFRSRAEGCELRFERYAPAAAWIDRSRGSVVPVWAIGRKLEELQAHLDSRPTVDGNPDANPDEGELAWSDVGLGVAGEGRTQLSARAVNGRIAWIEAGVAIGTGATADGELIAQLNKLFGKGSTDEGPMQWKRSKPPVALESTSTPGKLWITVGTPVFE